MQWTDQPKAWTEATAAIRREWLSMDEIAILLGVSRRWVERRIAAGAIPSVKIHGLRRIRRTEFEAYCSARRHPACS